MTDPLPKLKEQTAGIMPIEFCRTCGGRSGMHYGACRGDKGPHEVMPFQQECQTTGCGRSLPITRSNPLCDPCTTAMNYGATAANNMIHPCDHADVVAERDELRVRLRKVYSQRDILAEATTVFYLCVRDSDLFRIHNDCTRIIDRWMEPAGLKVPR
jgi:hypothetical protein